MLLALAPLVFLVLAPPALRDPPIKIKLSDDVYLRGERARVKVKTIENGYLLVVRADAQGRIRVLFPQEPGDAAAIRGGREVEIRSRGNREAFTVDDADGSGKILAAVSRGLVVTNPTQKRRRGAAAGRAPTRFPESG